MRGRRADALGAVAVVAALLAAAVGMPGQAKASPASSGRPQHVDAAPTRAGRVPEPEGDPFYRAPQRIGRLDPGDVVRSRPIPAKVYDLPVPASAWQIAYRTSDRLGHPTMTVTTLLVPRVGGSGRGPRPLVSYQTAEDGVAGHCAPSYALRAGIAGGFSGSYSETGLIGLALLRGWAVAAPDYEGPDSQFLVADVAARAVLDGIRAVQRFGHGRLEHSPVGIWGYSGGSLATVSAAQLQQRYAPRLKIVGIALGGLLGDVRRTIDAFSGSIGGGAIPMGINGFLRAYPKLHLLRYLKPAGRTKVEETAGDCLFDSAPRYPLLKVSDIEIRPGALDAPPVAAMLRANSPRFRRGTPTAPVYHYHAKGDEFAPIGPARAVVRRFCRGGVQVQVDEKLVGEHLTEIALGAPGAVAFLAHRFAGDTPVDDCP